VHVHGTCVLVHMLQLVRVQPVREVLPVCNDCAHCVRVYSDFTQVGGPVTPVSCICACVWYVLQLVCVQEVLRLASLHNGSWQLHTGGWASYASIQHACVCMCMHRAYVCEVCACMRCVCVCYMCMCCMFACIRGHAGGWAG
jgi:hypothetical protein